MLNKRRASKNSDNLSIANKMFFPDQKDDAPNFNKKIID